MIFDRQINKIKPIFENINLDDPNLYWYFNIFYNNKKSDASIELIFDFLQSNGIIKNDNNIRYYTVNAKEFNNITPHIHIIIYRYKNESNSK